MRITALLLFTLFLTACSGGSGGGNDSSPARGALEVIPRQVELGQDLVVSLSLSDISDDLAVKFRVPAIFRFVDNSGVLVDSEGRRSQVVPEFNVEEKTSISDPTPTPTPVPTGTPGSGGGEELTYDKRYIVFFIRRDEFGGKARGNLSLKLRARGSVLRKGYIELDIDIDDPSIANSKEFSLKNPLFEEEDLVDVYIRN